MIYLEWISMVLVLAGVWAIAEGYLKLGFAIGIVSCATWAVVAYDAELWGLLALQAGIAVFDARGLWRLHGKTSSNTYRGISSVW